jgi:uncharacterized OB-fold protein
MTGIIDVATYVPVGRLKHAEIKELINVGNGKGERSVMNFDEDTTTMAVEAINRLDKASVGRSKSLWFSTTDPAYVFKSNSAAVHAACSLPASITAFDLGQSVRSSFGAIRAASESLGICVCADSWTGLPGSDEERSGADGSGAIIFGNDEDSIAVIKNWKSHVVELLERWKTPSDEVVQTWDERFIAEILTPAIQDLLGEKVADAKTIVAVSSANSRIPASLSGCSKVIQNLDLGYFGAADPIFKLHNALMVSSPGDTILLVVVADGLELLELTVTEKVESWKVKRDSKQTSVTRMKEVSYTDFLTWRGRLDRQLPRRPDPQPPAGPPSFRNVRWKFGLNAQKCTKCGTMHTPPEHRCRGCGSIGNFSEVCLAGQRGEVVTFTIDRLAFTPSPPMAVAVVDFGNGARSSFEFTDFEITEIAIGMQVEMTFRIINTAAGIRNYFWKILPVFDN